MLFSSLSLAFLSLAAIPSLVFADDLTIPTVEGPVQGTRLQSSVRQWLGIPYAGTTAGVFRWTVPRPALARNTVFDASSFGFSCPQSLGPQALLFLNLTGINGNVSQSEDCLNLNIWAPPVTRANGTAVLIWVYGGSFEFGTSNTPYYNGEAFVRDNDDITVVTINYRVNIFSGPNAPQFARGIGNFGLSDIEAAINWVHDNIAGFGGDPNRITIFGESAGAIAVDAYAYTHQDDKIVKGIISESGVVTLGSLALAASGNQSAPDSDWNTVAGVVGCGTTPSAAQLVCMKSVPFDVLEKTAISNKLSFSFVVDNITFLSDYDSRSIKGEFLKVPYLLGSNANEGDVFMAVAELLAINFTIPYVTEVASDIITWGLFNCPASNSSSHRVKAGVPTYRYHYSAVFPNLTPRSDMRAYHTSEIPVVFGTYNLSVLPIPPTPAEVALSKYVQSAWVAFARDPASGLRGTGFSWPLYNPDILTITPTLAELGGSNNASGVHFLLPIEFDAVCGLDNDAVTFLREVLDKLGWF